MKIPGGFAPKPHNISFLLTFNFFNIHQTSTHYSANIKTFPGGFAHRPPRISFLFTFNFSPLYIIYILPINIHQTQRFLLILSTNIKKILGASPPYPLIYPQCLYSTSPPYISFLSTFTRPQDFSSIQRKCQKFSWGLRPQTPTYFLPVYIQYANLILSPSYILPVNIQLLPLLYPTYQHSPDPKISTHYSANFKNFPGGFAPRPLISPSCLHSTSPPYISFLSIFTRPQDFSSIQRKR